MKKTFNTDDLMYAVATFNADPYRVVDEDMAQEILAEIESSGFTMITDPEERTIALRKLDLPEDSERIVYQAGGCLFSMDGDEYTYDVVFQSDYSSDNEGFHSSLEYCKDYIEMNNGWDQADVNFKFYKGGTVQIICNETEEVVFETTVK